MIFLGGLDVGRKVVINLYLKDLLGLLHRHLGGIGEIVTRQ